MKTVLILLTALVLIGCSGSKELEFASLNQDPCKNEVKLNNPNEFVGETVENLTVYQQGDQVYAAMEVRTYCNARINFDVEQVEKEIRLKLFNEGAQSGDCVCIVNVSTSLKNVEEGTYNVLVTNRSGNQLLATRTVTVRD
jgi:hypothetical protein